MYLPVDVLMSLKFKIKFIERELQSQTAEIRIIDDIRYLLKT